MTLDVEDLLRSGMERFTEDVEAPPGLVARAARARGRRRALRTAAAMGAACAVVSAVAVTAATGALRAAPPAPVQSRMAAYVIKRVQLAVAGQHLVMHARTASNTWGPSVVWGYGPRNRFVEFTGAGCGHALPSGECTHAGASERYLSQGTAVIGGKLTEVYVTYYNREWSLVPGNSQPPASACSKTGAMEMAGPPPTPSQWPAFIHATLACGAATVTGHVRINGQETTKITAKPVTAPLPPGQAKAVGEKYVQAQWTLYVDSDTYLPVRLSGWNETFGGPAPRTYSGGVTDIQWLPPTSANVARSVVTIPAGFHRVSSAADQ